MEHPLPQVQPSRDADASHSTVGEVLAGVEPPLAVRSVYVHVPFCFHKCHYCDFYSLVDTRDRQHDYLDRVRREIDANAALRQRLTWRSERTAPDNEQSLGVDTIFVGGGTPTLLQPALLDDLLSHLAQAFEATPRALEFTVEANPETVTDEVADALARRGVNRVSLGAQSFHPVHLKTLERWHEPESVSRAVEILRAAGLSNLNLDLIFGVPGQTLGEWIADLEQALALAPAHLSCYALTYEPNTAMTARLRAGEFEAVDDDLEAEMFTATRALLRDRGFDTYEISNFAKRRPPHSSVVSEEIALAVSEESPDFRCRHNLAYWRDENWLAIGPSASGHVGNRRWKVVPHLATYLRDDLADVNGFPSAIDIEIADPATQLAERIMMGLRLAEGMPLDQLLVDADAFGQARALNAAVERCINHGWLDHRPRDGRLALTESGLLLANTVISDLMGSLIS